MDAKLPEKFEEFRRFVIDPANEGKLLGYLDTYSAVGNYTGAHFHELTVAGPSHPDRFDIADIASLALLSVTLNGKMAKQLTKRGEETSALEAKLSREPDRDLAGLSAEEIAHLEHPDNGLYQAWKQIGTIHGIGQTRTSKLLARKRPRLVPIWDSVISSVLGLPDTKHYWTAFHTALTMDGGKLDERLGTLAQKAGVAERYSRIRVLDILAWMHGTTAARIEKDVLTELDVEPESGGAPASAFRPPRASATVS